MNTRRLRHRLVTANTPGPCRPRLEVSPVEVLHRRTTVLCPGIEDRLYHLSLHAMFVRVHAHVARELFQVQAALVVLFPREILVIQVVVGVEFLQVHGKLLRRREVADVDERVRREEGRVVGTAQHDRNDVEADDAVQFLRYIFLAETVLER